MTFTARVTTVWAGNTGLEWEQLRDTMINDMVSAGKTDGALTLESTTADGLTYHRDFIDRAAAQEFVDWWNTTTAPSVAMISITDI